MQQSDQTVNLFGSLTKALGIIKRHFFESSLELLLKESKKFSQVLLYFLKIFKFGLLKCQGLQATLQECAYFVSCIVDSLEHTKYGHIFSSFGFLAKKLADSAKGLTYPEHNQNILGRILKNQSSPLYKTIRNFQVSTQELNYIQVEKLQHLIQLVENKEISLHNRECICCSNFLVKDRPLHNQNPIFRTILTLNSFILTDLQKLLSSIANQNGGVIIIGGKKAGDSLQAVGLKFSSYQQIQKAEKQINQAIFKLKPYCRNLVEKVQVHNSFLTKEKGPFLFCFRVRIFPQQSNKLSYLELTSKNYSHYYEIYKLDQNENAALLKCREVQNSIISPYTTIHQKYYEKKTLKINNHEGILCYRPQSNISNIFSQAFAQQIKNQEQFLKETQETFKDSPHFKYVHTTLIIVNTPQDDRYIKEFYDELLMKKNLVQLIKPFPLSFKCNPGDRSIWMLSHQMTFAFLRNKLAKYQQKYENNMPSIRILPVQTNLQIQKSKFSEYNQKLILNKFKERYPQGYVMEIREVADKNKCKVTLAFFTFEDYEQAIYAYMIMEERHLKPYFTKAGKVYTK